MKIVKCVNNKLNLSRPEGARWELLKEGRYYLVREDWKDNGGQYIMESGFPLERTMYIKERFVDILENEEVAKILYENN